MAYDLDPKYSQQIDQCLGNCAKMSGMIQRCKSCGIDTAAMEQIMNEQRDQLMAFKAQFFTSINQGVNPEAAR